MKLSKIYNGLKKNGIKGSLNIFLHRFFGISCLYEINLENFDKKELENYPYNFKLIDDEVMKKIFSEEEIPLYKKKILQDRIKNYKETLNYVVVDKEDNIMGHFCIALKNTQINPYINKYLKIERDTTYFFDDFTIEYYRKKGIQTYSLLKRMEISKKFGYKKSMILTYNFNIGAQKAMERSGMKKVQNIYKINLFKKQFLIYGRRLRNENM